MKGKTMFGIFAIAAVALIATSGIVAAFGGLSHDLSDEERSEMLEKREQMKEAIENQDYEAWSALMNERIARMQDKVNEEHFNEVVAKHSEMQEFRDAMKEARENEDYEAMKELKEQYGFEGRKGFHKHFR